MPRTNAAKIECPHCGHRVSKAVDTRAIGIIDGRKKKRHAVKRRRQCLGCGKRFTTIEAHERDVLEPLKGQKTWL